MSIPSYDFLEKPYDGAILEYDYDENRYVPLVDGIKANAYVALEREWTTANNAQCYLDLVSRVVYEAILANKDQKYRNKILYYLSHSKDARAFLIKIFSDSVWYNRRDGGFMMAYNSGANLNQGKLIEFGIDKAISPIAKQMLRNTIYGARIFAIDINEKEKFASLATLLAYLSTNPIATVTSGNFIVGEEYTILVVGTTNFTLVGASSNEIGVVFIATGTGNKSETGTATTTYITTTEADVVELSEDLDDLPYHEDYDVILLDSDKYLFTDLETLSTAVQNMKKYNDATGDW